MAATHPSSPDTAAEATTAGSNNADKSAATSDDTATSTAATSSQSTANQKSNDTTNETNSSPTPSSLSSNNMPLPTYLSTKSSKAYTMSKQLLSSGSLDDALSTLEMTLQLSREILLSSLGSSNNNKNDNSTNIEEEGEDDTNIELHESLAPLYYLYGTTLLYSVEESDVMMANDQTKVTTTSGGGAPSDIDVSPEEDDMKFPSSDEYVDAEQSTTAAMGGGEEYANDDGGVVGDDDEGGEVQEVSDPAEDLQIAWENLDLARTIVTRLVDEFKPSSSNNNNNNGTVVLKSEQGNLKNDETNPIEIINNGIHYTSNEQHDLLLDLAQIHTRLGDLQRANANILPCIDDYNLALELRTFCLGKFDKKVADSQFSLGQVYAEAPNRVGENEGMVSDFVNSLGGPASASGGPSGGGSNDGVELTEEEKIEMRSKSLEHYLACGVAFAGIMAKMCGEDAEKFTSFVNNEESNGSCAASAAAVASAKSSSSTSNSYAKTMTKVRERLSSLSQTNLSAAAKEEFDDLKEMLDEIQEAMDSAEDTEEGLKTLGEMKANEIKKHDMKQNGEDGAVVETSEDGATTTIGFGAPSTTSSSAFAASASSSSTVNAFGSTSKAAAAASATAAPTMMVVKKKKKKAVLQQPLVDDSAKRLKTSE